MDFFHFGTREVEGGPRKGTVELFPDFTVGRSKDLMVRGRGFYAIWDEEKGLWSTDEYDVQRLVDKALYEYAEAEKAQSGMVYTVKPLKSFKNHGWAEFRRYMQNISDNSHQLDEKLTFANTDVKKTDHVSKRLSYSLGEGDHSAWDELIGTLYSVEERAKIEWAIGAVISGDSKKIQKFLVLYGPAGTGKSTILNIVQKLFEGYTTSFEAKALSGNNNAFATEAFKGNPLVAIQHDGDLSKIEDNTKLNSIISHEEMTMNEKYKPSYTSRVNAFLFMGTNQPVKITDSKSGIIRRLIDVHPTGITLAPNHYNTLMSKIDFELGAIAQHCLSTYRQMGKNYYSGYKPLEMMLQTDVFFNFVEYAFDTFKEQEYTSLKQAYSLYKEFCEETGIDRNVLPQYKFREELRNYFDDFFERKVVDGETLRSVYSGFNANKYKAPAKDGKVFSLVMDETVSIFDRDFGNCFAQGATPAETPRRRWEEVKTTLSELDTSEVHFVKVPEQHIVIDFDLKDENGTKALERNLAAASLWPPTYAEVSKSGNGVHLHYDYEGDVTELSSKFAENIEVKTLLGNASLRRKLTKCNNTPVATISSGIPFKEKNVLDAQTIKSEKGLRDLIGRNLRKEINPGTKSSVDFIKKILDDAYESGMSYDVTDLRSKIVAFANNSTNQAMVALKTVQQMKFASENSSVEAAAEEPGQFKTDTTEDRVAFYDVEVYPNLFVVCWKFIDSDEVVRMINPGPAEIEKLFKLKLVGFNNRKYDNHILWGRYLGYDNDALYKLSKGIIENDFKKMFGEAYNVSYTDIYDFSSKKQSLKKFQIELGLPHMEMSLPWDEPVDQNMWDEVVEYCVNDVKSTEAVFKSRKGDFDARQILAELSGLTVNDTTQRHTARIVFGNDRNPQRKFKYTHLDTIFEGYTFVPTRKPKSDYRGEDPSEGGYVYAEPGIYRNVALLDVASMHPTSIELLELFGAEYTPRFSALKSARLAIKSGDYNEARKMLDGKLIPYLEDKKDAKALSDALKIAINIVYGLTSAKFDNPFRDHRNVDNIVAKRGALFMIDLKHAAQEKGLTVAHIKTDSIKIPNAKPEDIQEIFEFGKKYGYDFEHEATYDRLCLVNDAVYIAGKWSDEVKDDGTRDYIWDATGAQFQHPYVFKTLFSHEDVTFDDLCETKQVAGAMYLDFEHDKPEALIENMHFVGRTGRFVPVKEGQGGGVLYRVKDGKKYKVTGTSGYLWMEAEQVKKAGNKVEIDTSYFEELSQAAVDTINKFGSFEEFVS